MRLLSLGPAGAERPAMTAAADPEAYDPEAPTAGLKALTDGPYTGCPAGDGISDAPGVIGQA